MLIRRAVLFSVLAISLSGGAVAARAVDEDDGKTKASQPAADPKPSSPASSETPDPKPADDGKETEDGKPAEETPAEQWAELKGDMDAIAKRLAELKKEFSKADRDEKAKIRDEFLFELSRYNGRIKPKLLDLAPVVYEQDPKNFLAGKFVVESNYVSDHYDEAAAAADKLLADGLKSKRIVNMAIVAHFAIQDFAKAKELFEKAEQDGTLDLYSLTQDPELAFHQAAGYVDRKTIDNYVGYWEKEQKTRAAEAELKGDGALPRVEFDTDRGKIVLELFENEAPNTVANFISLVEAGTYDGTKFHRVVPGFVAQGGDPNSKDDDPTNDGLGGPGYTIKCECFQENARKHFRGSLSMAHSGKDTGGSQFFITRLPTAHLNPDPTLETGHTVFGRVVEGLHVAESLKVGDIVKKAKVLNKRNHEYKPVTSKDAPEKPKEKDETEKPKGTDEAQKPKETDEAGKPKEDEASKDGGE
jgi:cyclophilin family peptidyl-prolyl cis-trans isomerase